MTFNIWRYYGDWEQRKEKIITYIKEEKPDIIFLQECFDDGRYNILGDNQAVQLNSNLNYKYCHYSISEMLRTENKQILRTSVFDGLGCISNIPIVEVTALRLTLPEGDDHFRILQRIIISKDTQRIIFYHIHLSNKDDWARIQLEETIRFAKKEDQMPIIVGDLNVKIPLDVINTAGQTHEISWVKKKYISYPSKQEVLDYVLLPKTKFHFLDIECSKEGLSDHQPLIVMVEDNGPIKVETDFTKLKLGG